MGNNKIKSVFKNKKLVALSAAGIVVFLVAAFFIGFGIYSHNLKTKPTPSLTEVQNTFFQQTIAEKYPEKVIRPLPYSVKLDTLPLHAKSAIVVDFASGCILYEKNADEKIPPASMTKLVLMYVALTEIANGKANFDDVVVLPKESWAKNAPPHSSLMFLGEGQHVTLDEIITGLNVVSGNDAAVAIAMYLFGSVEECIAKMNETARNFGLKNTHFEEVSGYSEKNLTTARDFSVFCVQYVKKFPFALKKYHSQKSFTYPKEHNLPDGWDLKRSQTEGVPLDGTMPIAQNATNKALEKIPYADGLKTGYIDESGYNLALSVLKNGQRLISVTMGGPGANSQEGGNLRAEDAVTITDWAYKAFSSVPVKQNSPVRLAIPGGAKYSCNLLEIPQDMHYLCVPNIKDAKGNPLELQKKIVVFDEKLMNNKNIVECGASYGQIEYYYGDFLIEKTPLVADRTVKRGNIFRRMYGAMARKHFSEL